jgi:hypothetical protein
MPGGQERGWTVSSTTPTLKLKLLLAAREAAAALSICEKTLWAHTRPRGSIPCVRIGSRVLYDPRDLEAWIDARKKGGEPK